MNRLNQFINDHQPSASFKQVEKYIDEANGSNDIYFPNASSLLIYAWELQGQISDGYWENSRPSNHWMWVSKTNEHIDKEKIGYTGPIHRIKYSTEWLRKYVKKALKGQAGDYNWTIRVFNIGKFGSLLSESEAMKLYNKDTCSYIVENMPEDEVNQEGLKEAFTAGKDWRQKYWEESGSFFTDEFLKKYYSSKYDWSDFEDDLDMATEAINTNI